MRENPAQHTQLTAVAPLTHLLGGITAATRPTSLGLAHINSDARRLRHQLCRDTRLRPDLGSTLL